MKKEILFVYTSKENRQMVTEIAKEHNGSISNVVTIILDSYRSGKKAKFDKVIPKYVKQADLWKSKHA